MSYPVFAGRCLAVAGLLAISGACGNLLPATSPRSVFYALEGVSRTDPPAPTAAAALTLLVSPPRAAPGFDSQHIIYQRAAHQLEYFAHSEWVDTPARMLAPLLVARLQQQGGFRAVVLTPSSALGELRLDSEILRLQQDFSSQPSRVELTLRAYLVHNTTRQVLAWREFSASRAAASDDAKGGVGAANAAIAAVLGELAIFCQTGAGLWRPAVAAAYAAP
ncbi:MAG: hypothetical protein H6R15_222 [Proteobacteria bacterium]|nr:hypothetical protein [Pseudomonadota bacterium]